MMHFTTRDHHHRARSFYLNSLADSSGARAALPFVSDVDIVVTDYAMPGEDGCWLLRQVETGPHRVPVIVVTGFGDNADVRRASFARVLSKPTDPWRLCADIREVLEQRHC